jgi:hypothetical protein
MTRWTSVVSYHTDPETCGVARFSKQLAERLGVPCIGFMPQYWGARPLLSIKWAELRMPLWTDACAYDQLWHDRPLDADASRMTGRIWKLYEIGVPALVERSVMAPQALVTMGMSHKIDLQKFIELRETFPQDQLWISTATHEGAGPSRVQELMLAWGDGARNLGHLSDAALQLVWPHALAFVAFFEQGLRANNSSVHAALDAGVPVITNHGPQTPSDLIERTADYRDVLPRQLSHSTHSPYTWDRLLEELGCEPSR